MRAPLLLAIGSVAALLTTACGATTDTQPSAAVAPPASPAVPVQGDSEELVTLVEQVLGDFGPTNIGRVAIVAVPENVPEPGDIEFERRAGDVALEIEPIDTGAGIFEDSRFAWEGQVVGNAVAARAREQGLPRVSVLIADAESSVLRPPAGAGATEADLDRALEALGDQIAAAGVETIETEVSRPYGLAATIVVTVHDAAQFARATAIEGLALQEGFEPQPDLYLRVVDAAGTPFYESTVSRAGSGMQVGSGYEGCVAIKHPPQWEAPPCPLEEE